MRERTHRHVVGARRGQFRQRASVTPPEISVFAAPAAPPHRLDDVGRREVVEQHDVRAGAQGVVHLRQALRLDFDRQPGLATPASAPPPAPRRRRAARGCP
jgi:hypothetical protein